MTTAQAPLTDRPHPALYNKQGGFTLIEVMVAVVVLVMGVLGAAAMTITAIRNGQQAGVRSTAVGLAYEASDIMRGNFTQYTAPPTVVLTTYGSGTNLALTSTCFTAGSGCTLSQMAQNDFFVWRQKVQNMLPAGNAVICRDSGTPAPSSDTPAAPSCNGSGPIVVKIWWTEKINSGATTLTGPNMTVPIQPI